MITRFTIVPGVPSPELSIQSSGGAALLLRWPTNAADFVLESGSTLLASNHWTAVTNLPVAVGTNNLVTNSLTGGSQFYRLRFVLKL